MSESPVDATIAAIWRIESPKIIAGLARIVRDVGRAEDLAQDAFVAAVSQWPDEGIPRNPAAWLMTAAKRRAIDAIRREKTFWEKIEPAARERAVTEVDFAADIDPIDDDLLRLTFVACHPILSKEARVALTLRLLGGLTTGEIARAFLVSESTMAQRIVRAKRTLAEANVPFEVPEAGQRPARLASVLEAIYLIFNEGYAPSGGQDVLRLELVEDALRLGRVLARLMPHEAEVHGLIALMELQASRLPARVGLGGEPILLLEQDRNRWNRLYIARGLAGLDRARALGVALGPYALQAAIASCHALAATARKTDWKRIAALYDALFELLPTPVVALNRAVAVGMAYGAERGLQLTDEVASEQVLQHYHWLPSVRADLLAKLGRVDEARKEFERAAALAHNERDRTLLKRRAAAI